MRGDPVWPRNAAVLIWVPVLLASPLLQTSASSLGLAWVALVLLTAAAAVVGVLASWPEPTRLSIGAWAVAFAIVTAGSMLEEQWAPAWLLVAMLGGLALPPAAIWVAVPVTAVAAAFLQYRHDPDLDQALTTVFVISLTGITAAVLNRLLVTNQVLRRTREQLATAAVAQERERVARDLHDVLGHTLSVIVVKAAAVRRLVGTDPAAAAVHAADIETVGRTALSRVREVVDDTAPPSIDAELAAARDALSTAGIAAELPSDGTVWEGAGEPLAWALREAVTNVLRHSGASHCRVELTRNDRTLRLIVADDGVGHLGTRTEGGLAGLRERLRAAGGDLDVQPGGDGFTLTAWVPDA